MKAFSAFAMLTLSGCSFALVKGPPPYIPPDQPIFCTESRAVPMIDGTFGGWAVVNAGLFLLTDSETLSKTEENTAALVMGVIGTGLTWSAIAGHDRVSKCSAAKLAEELRIGSLDGTGPDAFGYLKGRVPPQDGGFDLLDSQVRGTARFFGPYGAHVPTYGGKRQGPGEFVATKGLMLGPNGRRWVPDARNRRMSVFDPEVGFTEALPFVGGNYYGWAWSGAADRGMGGPVYR